MANSLRRRLFTRAATRRPAARRTALNALPLEARDVPATFTVVNTGDATTSGSLRWAIGQANATAGADSIAFSLGASPQTITLTSDLPTVTDSVTITGPGAASLTVNGAGQFRPFTINNGATTSIAVPISKLTVANGATTVTGGAGLFTQDESVTLSSVAFTNNLSLGATVSGGAIYQAAAGGRLTLSNCTFTNNGVTATVTTSFSGGAVYANAGSVTVNGGTQFSGNSAFFGGAIYSQAASVNVTSATFDGNAAKPLSGQGSGGAIYSVTGPVTITTATFSNNSAGGASGSGGAVALGGAANLTVSSSTFNNNTAGSRGGAVITTAGGTITVDQSTFSNNAAGTASTTQGGAIAFVGGTTTALTVTIRNSTVADNTASGGAAVALLSNATLTLTNTIVAGNTNQTAGKLADLTNSTGLVTATNSVIGAVGAGLVLTPASANNRTGTLAAPLDPLLAALANNGGPTQTRLPLAGSPALNNGATVAAFTTDQRGTGFPRESPAGFPDIGAAEVTATGPVAKLGTALNPAAGSSTYSFTVVYGDAAAIKASSVNGNTAAVIVTGPTGTVPLTSAVIDTATDGTPRTVTYTLAAPGGTFNGSNVGVYSITTTGTAAAQATNAAGSASVPATTLGTFGVYVPTTFTVTNADYAGPGSLRDAVAAANANLGTADTIAFQAGLTGTINLLTALDTISDSLTITGIGASVTVSGGGLLRPFYLLNATTTLDVAFTDFTITGGSLDTGGAIYDSGEKLTLTGMTLTGNAANFGTNGFGGAVYLTGGATGQLVADRTTFANNSANTLGGAIYQTASTTLTVRNSTFSGNAAKAGGAVYVFGAAAPAATFVTLDQTTLSGNSASSTTGGGAVAVYAGVVLVRNSTLTGNTAGGPGGAIAATNGYTSPTITLQSTIVAGNTATTGGPDLARASGEFAITNSLIGAADNVFYAGTGNSTGTAVAPLDPQLAPLANYGGPTQTQPPLATSPAVGRGANPAGFAADQRGAGFPRRVGAAVDVGAAEYGGTAPSAAAGPLPAITVTNAGPYTFTVTYDDDTAVLAASAQGNTAAVGVTGLTGATITSAVIDTNTNGRPRTVTYTLSPGGGAFTAAQNGTYTVALNAGQVTDTAGNSTGGTLGVLRVAVGSKYTVTTLADSGPGSLRQAILDSNTATPNALDLIGFQPGLFGTITLGTALPTITDSVTLDGAGAGVTVSGRNAVQAFFVNSPTAVLDVSLANLTVANGFAAAGGGLGVNGERLTLTNMTFRDNAVSAFGGAVYVQNAATVAVADSVFRGNAGPLGGGAIYAAGQVAITVGTTRFEGNTAAGATGKGGAVYVTNVTGTALSVGRSTFSGNSAGGNGGAVYLYTGLATFDHTTLSGNRAGTATAAGFGGAIADSSATLNVRNSTVVNNTSGTGGGAVHLSSATATLNLVSSIVSNNSGGGATPDVSNPAGKVNATNSLLGTVTTGLTLATDTANQKGTTAAPLDAKLTPLAYFGGPTPVHYPLLASPAVDAGSNPTGAATDQRGAVRTFGAATDVGAAERTGVVPYGLLPAGGAASVGTAGGTAYTFTVVYTDDNAIAFTSANGATGAVTVTGPQGPLPVTAAVASGSGNAPAVTVTYTATPPGGSFDFADSGVYTVALTGGVVTNSGSVPVNGGLLGTFAVAVPGTATVTNLNDSGPGSLRQAILDTNAVVNTADTIAFQAGLTGTITLGSALDTITDSVTVNGAGASVTLDGNNAYRLFNVVNQAVVLDVRLANLTLQKGGGVANGAGVSVTGESLTLTNVVFQNNATNGVGNGSGGALYVAPQGTVGAVVAVSNSTFRNNTSAGAATATTGGGGAAAVVGTGNVLTITASTLSGNAAGQRGGAVYFSANSTLTVDNSTFANNTSSATGANGGGAIALYSGSGTTALAVTVRNSTLTGNTAPSGTAGGVLVAGTVSTTLAITSSIVAGNTAATGRDVVRTNTTASTVTVGTSLIGAADAAAFAFTDAGGNATGTLASPLDPQVTALANNGGPTQTVALKANSPAINLGSNPTAAAYDQRGVGFPRQVGAGVDAGAFELTTTNPVASLDAAPAVTLPGGTTYTFSVEYSDDVGIKASSAQGNTAAVTVTGPNGFTAAITSAVINVNADGTPRTVTYTFAAPGGTFDIADNGVYTIAVNGNQVRDGQNNAVAAGTLGTFSVAVGRALTVTNTLDDGPGSLRAAIQASNGDAGVTDTIAFQAGLTGTITLATALDTISNSVAIQGPGAASLTVSGGGAVRPFELNGPGVIAVAISGLTITQGSADRGGAILNAGESLTLTRVVVSQSSVTVAGGAVFLGSDDFNNPASGSLAAVECWFDGNTDSAGSGGPAVGGGAIHVGGEGQASATLTRSTFSNNTAGTAFGGAVQVSKSVNLPATRFGTLTVENSTFAGNAGGSGGAIQVSGVATIHNSTLAGNVATASGFNPGGGGLRVFSTASVTVISTLFADNSVAGSGVGPDIYNNSDTPISITNSLITNTAGVTFGTDTANLKNVSAGLDAALANNGGPTPTRRLLNTSPAVDAGSNPAGLTTDQRGAGFARVFGAAADIGAYEAVVPAKVTGYVVNGGANQRSLVTTIRVNFSAAVTATGALASAFAVTPEGGGAAVPASVTLTNGGTAAVLTFPSLPLGSLADGYYTLTVNGNQLTSGGIAVDADGDGTAGGTFASAAGTLFRYLADADGDGAVDGNDLAALAQAFNSVQGDTNYRAYLDFDGDGAVDGNDLAVLAQRFNTVL